MRHDRDTGLGSAGAVTAVVAKAKRMGRSIAMTPLPIAAAANEKTYFLFM